ncbi:hypothetical protein JCM10212_005643 [Sporobolomyces blumeae]
MATSAGVTAYLSDPPEGQLAFPYWLKGVDEGLLHPTPTEGFRTRLIVLLTLTVIYTTIAATYGIVTVVRTDERPRKRAFWFARLVQRPSGRFIVLNPRIAWSLGGVITGLWSIALIYYNWQAFLHHGDQSAMWGFRAMNTFVFFCVAWMSSWCALQAYLLTADSPKTKLPSAMKANLLFLVGGAVLAALSFTFALYQSIRGQEFWFAGGDLRAKLVEYLNATPSGTPSTQQMDVLVPLADATARAWHELQVATVIHATFSPILPVACLIVNSGGLALVVKLRRQIRESTSVFASTSHAMTSDDPADWRGPSPAASPRSDLEEKMAPPISPPPPPIATSAGALGWAGTEQYRALWNLKRAQVDMTALTVYLTISCIAFTAAFILSDFVMIAGAGEVWPLAEGAFGSTLWQTTICGPFLYGFLLFNSTSNRFASPSRSSLEPALSTTGIDSLPVLRTSPRVRVGSDRSRESPRSIEERGSRWKAFVPSLKRVDSSTPMMTSTTPAASSRSTRDRDEGPRGCYRSRSTSTTAGGGGGGRTTTARPVPIVVTVEVETEREEVEAGLVDDDDEKPTR